jgi:COMM domain containing 9
MMERERGAAALWGHGHLPLLARARSKNSVEYILQALWRTRRTGLDAADRAVARDILQLAEDADLDAVRESPHPCHSPPLCDAVQLVVNPD